MAIYLDTETTGFSPTTGAAIVEIAIVDESGQTLIDTLIDPRRAIPWQAQQIHGISDDMVRGKPTLQAVLPRIREIIAEEELVIYNAAFDKAFFPDRLRHARAVSCAMTRFSDALGGPWRKLDVAARHVGHEWTGNAHRALADALACRSVWLWLESRKRQR
jgi:DNA polymerase III epsilon subunit-like protein